MKTILLIFLTVFLIAAAGLGTLYILGLAEEGEPAFFYQFSPLWELEDQFQSSGAISMNSSGVVRDTLSNFWQHYIRHIDKYFSEELPIDPDLNQHARQVISQAFLQDTIRLPFTQAYLDKILENTYFYFAYVSEMYDLGFIGQYIPQGSHSYVFVSSFNVEKSLMYLTYLLNAELISLGIYDLDILGPEYRAEFESELQELAQLLREMSEHYFIFTTLHELGHAFGLGETLSDLFAESLLDINYSFRGQEGSYAALGIFGEDGGFAYNSTFDRSLLRHLERQGRGNDFWEGAFHSNAVYNELWNSVFGGYILAEDLELARAVYYNAMFQESGILARNFERDYSGGVTLAFAGELMLRDWESVMVGGDGLNRLQWLTGVFTEFAASQGIEPLPNVLDHVIWSHIYRYNN